MSSDEEIFGDRPKEYFKVENVKSGGFLASCIYMGFMGLIPIFLGILGFKGIYFSGKPTWYFVVNIIIGIVMCGGAVMCYNFKKMGVYLFSITIIINILFHLSLGFEQLDAIHGLYLFIGFALVPIIPRWKYFK